VDFFIPDDTKVVDVDDEFPELTAVGHDVWVKDFVLTKEHCASLIERFKTHNGHHLGLTGNGFNPEVKDTLDLNLVHFPEFVEDCDIFQREIRKGFREMLQLPEFSELMKYSDLNALEQSHFSQNLGYQIQMYKPGGKYIYHFEQCFQTLQTARRSLVYTMYLNEDFEQGHTHFPRQKIAVKPKIGRMVLFDSSWSNVHAGMEVKGGEKFMMTGWVLGNLHVTMEEFEGIQMSVKDAKIRVNNL
jgi:prolyl 4-hydroxylase